MKRLGAPDDRASCVPRTYQDGTVFQAGAMVSGSPSRCRRSAFCAVANARACNSGKPLAKTSGYFAGS